jgi:hypothetical protein
MSALGAIEPSRVVDSERALLPLTGPSVSSKERPGGGHWAIGIESHQNDALASKRSLAVSVATGPGSSLSTPQYHCVRNTLHDWDNMARKTAVLLSCCTRTNIEGWLTPSTQSI